MCTWFWVLKSYYCEFQLDAIQLLQIAVTFLKPELSFQTGNLKYYSLYFTTLFVFNRVVGNYRKYTDVILLGVLLWNINANEYLFLCMLRNVMTYNNIHRKIIVNKSACGILNIKMTKRLLGNSWACTSFPFKNSIQWSNYLYFWS